jgi:hypothetical protein
VELASVPELQVELEEGEMTRICLLSHELLQTSRSPTLEFIVKITTKFYRAVFEVYLNFTLRETFSGTTSHVLVHWDVVHKRVAI